MLEMSKEDAADFVKTWYCAIFFWGYLVYNGLRVYIISLLAPGQAKNEHDNNATGCWGKCSCSQWIFIPRESVEIGLDVLAVMDIK